jgi:hypothetical protein
VWLPEKVEEGYINPLVLLVKVGMFPESIDSFSFAS